VNPAPASLLTAILWVATATMAGAADESAADPAAVSELISQAEAERRRAAEGRAEWLQTSRLIDEARQQADQGNWTAAADLAGKALRQSRLALEQAAREQEAWRDRVVR
jgi:hypothetical protein